MSTDLHSAISHHQAGRLDLAAQFYQNFLAAQPRNADALHLLGVLEHQRGRPQIAVDLIHQALAKRPEVAAFHANLAEVLRSLGQLDRAVVSCRNALRLQPNYPEALNNLGLALMGLGRFDEARSQFQEAIRWRPAFAMAHNNLGNALREQGQTREAVAAFRQALACEPQLLQAHANLAQMLLEQDDLESALHHGQEAVRLGPNVAESHNNLGNVLRELGCGEDARRHYAKALRLNPNLGLTYNNMAQSYQAEGQFTEAAAWYEQALQCEPASARIYANFASCLEAQERYGDAAERYRIALQFDPDHASARNGLGWCLQEMGLLAEAEASFRAAIRLKPQWPGPHVNLGTLLEELGHFDQSEVCYREALRHAPNHAVALGQLATLLHGQLSDQDRDHMETALSSIGPVGTRRAHLLHGLARVYDSLGDFQRAASLLQEANALRKSDWQRKGQGYNPDEHSRFVDRIISLTDRAFFERRRGFGLDTKRPVFIVGLPRSATTLTEQILARHFRVYGAGELRLGREAFDSLPAILRLQCSPVEGLAHLNCGVVRRLVETHLDALRTIDAEAERIVDKMPDNYLYLGLLAVMFPKATFIHTRRDLRDVAVSCWMTHFKHIRWACDPHHIATRFRDYLRLMDHWRSVLPVPLREVDYKETITDFESVARKLLSWCDLEWEPACLGFHESRRPIRTASLSQVRQPLFKKSLDRWRNYDPYLNDWFATLPAS